MLQLSLIKTASGVGGDLLQSHDDPHQNKTLTQDEGIHFSCDDIPFLGIYISLLVRRYKLIQLHLVARNEFILVLKKIFMNDSKSTNRVVIRIGMAQTENHSDKPCAHNIDLGETIASRP